MIESSESTQRAESAQRTRRTKSTKSTKSTQRAVSNLLGLAVLGLLAESPAHPHALATTLRERGLDRAFKVTTGSLYDVVRALERAGWIEAVETVRVGGRPERTVYRHTGTGGAEFARWVDDLVRVPATEHPKFLAAVTYLGILGPEGAAEALRERAGRLRAELDELRAEHRAVLDSGRVPRLFVLEVEYAVRVLEAELGWVEEIVDDVESGRLAWPAAENTETTGNTETAGNTEGAETTGEVR
ncbi:PadR family transcriptional regulator [Saccharothrix xinjiangensis]|uniref:PadR family transcriptional regulator n=1 Tax=Saccharothrix xinjiangensis TaxID=204798 RepID=A0ABV9XU01_9PSEU